MEKQEHLKTKQKQFCAMRDCENYRIIEGFDDGYWICDKCEKRDADFNINMDGGTK